MSNRILLVDDDIAEISAVKRVLLRAGHQTTLATNRSDALVSIATARPELIVVALACENGEGAVLARQIAGEDGTRGIPMILLGSGDLDGAQARTVPLPVDPATLEGALRAAFEGEGPAPAQASASTRGGGRAPALRNEATPASSTTATGNPPRAPAAAWFEGDALRPEPAPPLDASAFEDAGGKPPRFRMLSPGPESQAGELLRRRQEAEAALLAERAAAEREAAEQLRLAQARRTLEERQAAQDAARRAAEEAEARRSLVAEAARRRVLAMAKERAGVAEPAAGKDDVAAMPAPELSQGSLGAISMPRLLALAARGRATGRLDVDSQPSRSLWLEEGRVVGAASSAPAERTEEVALRLGLITRDQHRQVASAVAGLASRRAGVLLLERGFLKPTELALLARRRAEEIAFALFACEAPYRFAPGERVPAGERLGMERTTLALAVEGVRRRWLSPRLDVVLGAAGTLLGPAAQPPPISGLALSEQEKRLWELADGLRTLDEILADAPLDPLSSRQVLAALVEVGALDVKVLAPAGTEAPPGSIDLVRIDEKLEQVRRSDYFVVLGLGRTCTPYEIREASERLLSELSPERFDSAATDLPTKIEEIRQVVEEARDILLDDALRAEYLAGLGE